MSDKSGYNPMRWDCEKQGCFNIKCRPKIEVFSGIFPGRINFGDVDGIVEINGKALLLEWKSPGQILRTGQRIMYERITKSGDFTVICIFGNAETMECEEYFLFFKGKQLEPTKCDLDRVKDKIRGWVGYAQKTE